ncbi:MAG: DUF480 domain-containing protein [Proteobacteria bacterium]|nr:MAG: DUF480 domain-containing protein [Pseudomonadota bacterium]
MDLRLTDIEARVLGALIEKEITTPEYYPLSLNALVNACNQKSNREPVMNLDEDRVRSALRSLSDQHLARSAASDSRVSKYEHRLNEQFNFHRHEIAILCVLLLRGPQTPGELRGRTERMYNFEGLDSVHSALHLLMKREPPLVTVLPRQPGTKESRYAHLVSGPPTTDTLDARTGGPALSTGASATEGDRVAQLEDEVASLRSELAALREQFAAFQKQFQ